jgi:hypothetical protein
LAVSQADRLHLVNLLTIVYCTICTPSVLESDLRPSSDGRKDPHVLPREGLPGLPHRPILPLAKTGGSTQLLRKLVSPNIQENNHVRSCCPPCSRYVLFAPKFSRPEIAPRCRSSFPRCQIPGLLAQHANLCVQKCKRDYLIGAKRLDATLVVSVEVIT